jgi:acyl dehydratase
MSGKSLASVKVGDRFEVSKTCTRYQPLYYAAAGGDFNPIHIDPEVGERAGLGGVILHGMCTMSWATEAVVGFLGDPTRLTKIKLRFSRPVQVDDTVTFRGEVTSVDANRIVGAVAAVNQRGEDVLKNTVFEARIG